MNHRRLKPGVILVSIVVILVGGITASITHASSAKTDNLLKNPQFSEITENGGPRYWNIQGPAKIVETNDQNCVLLQGSDWSALTQDVVLTPGKVYEISFRIKSDFVKHIQIVLDGAILNPTFGKKKWSYSIHGAFSYYKISDHWTIPMVRFKVTSIYDDKVKMTILAEGRKAKEVLISEVTLREISEYGIEK
ncbi:MAG: hypothetical protein HQ580_02615 [Planctomycetes bacterium]|nr:hypothetical protein [Planctomycetota bacterium]